MSPALVDVPQAREALKTVYDPEIPIDIYEMGMIYAVRVEGNGYAHVKMTLTTPACPVAGTLPGEVEDRVAAVEGVTDASVAQDRTYFVEVGGHAGATGSFRLTLEIEQPAASRE